MINLSQLNGTPFMLVFITYCKLINSNFGSMDQTFRFKQVAYGM